MHSEVEVALSPKPASGVPSAVRIEAALSPPGLGAETLGDEQRKRVYGYRQAILDGAE